MSISDISKKLAEYKIVLIYAGKRHHGELIRQYLRLCPTRSKIIDTPNDLHGYAGSDVLVIFAADGPPLETPLDSLRDRLIRGAIHERDFQTIQVNIDALNRAYYQR